MSEHERLKDQYKAMPHGSARVQAIQKAVKKADDQKDHAWQIIHRFELADELHFYGDCAKTLPIIARATELFEQEPLESYVYDYLFAFYEALDVWNEVPQLSLEQREQVAEKFFYALKRYGYSTSLYHERQYMQRRREGRFEEAEREYELRFTQEPGVHKTLARCKACEQGMRILHALNSQNWQEAMELAKPILDGTLSCRTEPWGTLKLLFEFAWYEGDRESLQFAGDRMLQRVRWDPVGEEWEVLPCYILSDVRGGLKAFERTLPDMLQRWSQQERQDYFQSVWLLLTRAAQTQETLSLSLPKEFALYLEDGIYHPKELAQWFHAAALEIAKKFDDRNGYPDQQNVIEKAGMALLKMTQQETQHS